MAGETGESPFSHIPSGGVVQESLHELPGVEGPPVVGFRDIADFLPDIEPGSRDARLIDEALHAVEIDRQVGGAAHGIGSKILDWVLTSPSARRTKVDVEVRNRYANFSKPAAEGFQEKCHVIERSLTGRIELPRDRLLLSEDREVVYEVDYMVWNLVSGSPTKPRSWAAFVLDTDGRLIRAEMRGETPRLVEDAVSEAAAAAMILRSIQEGEWESEEN